MSSLQIQTGPASEPVTLATLKNHLRISLNTDDDLLTIYLQAARELVENESGRSLANKTYRQSHDRFPCRHEGSGVSAGEYFYSAPTYARKFGDQELAIKLLRCPLVNVDDVKITYIGTDEAPHDLLPDDDFLVDADSEPPRLMPLQSQVWPATLRVPNAVQIFFPAGYSADGAAAPAAFKVAMMQLCGVWYENREAVSSDALKEIPKGYENLIWSGGRVIDFNPTP